MKIFIDFDGVIFNAERFRNDIKRIFIKSGFSERDFDRTYSYLKQKGIYYSPERQARILNADNNKKKEISASIEKLLADSSKKYIFKDVRNFLGFFKKKDIYILSLGNINFQNKKIKSIKLGKYFKKIIVTDKSKDNEIKKIIKKEKIKSDEKIFFIDDSANNIEIVKTKNPKITTIHLLRKNAAQFSKCADFEARNLGQVLGIYKLLIK